MEISLGIVCWICGFCGFLFWWKRQYEGIELADLLSGLLARILGPMAWIVGWTVHGAYVRKRP
ncbi:MAG: hypothetical protein JW993_10790 [Sedimentisphaerales bacterium]|nr:hypothetical protein [Sedimentisphaerales bacterium]